MLDRDGVLVDEAHHLHRREDVRIAAGAVDLIRLARAQGWLVCVVTNQSGIARNLFGWDEFDEVQNEIQLLLGTKGAGLDMVVACPFHPEFTQSYGKDHAYWRKPGHGMLKITEQRLNIDLSASWIIGDRHSDLEAGRRAGLAGGIIVQTGYGKSHAAKTIELRDEGFEVWVARDMFEATERLRARLTRVTTF